MKRISLAIFVVFCLAACGTLSALKKSHDETENWKDDKFYSEAKKSLDKRDYDKAIKYLTQIEIRFPYSRFATQAQIDLAYAEYKNGDSELAINAIERFVKLHPNSPAIDYAYYLKALCNFRGDLGLFSSYIGQDPTERDPKAARDAFEGFKELAIRFPNSKYTPDAIERMRYLIDALASYEIHVARYYLRRGAYIAAANRVQYSLKEYPQAPANEEGLLIMVKAYDALGLTDLRDDAERVMKANFPNSKYLKGDVPSGRRWWQIWNEGSDG
jgi:outer membrane protein assembly factor BamD